MKKYLIDDRAMQRFRVRALSKSLSLQHPYVDILDHLLSRLDYIRLAPQKIINLGWHSKVAHEKLKLRYPAAEIIDVADPDELQHFPSQSVELIIAHFAFFSHSNPKEIMQACHRLLTIEGLLLFVDCGPDTLQELRESFAAVDDKPHVHSFFDMHHVGDWLRALQFSDPVMDCEMLTFAYKNLPTFFKELKMVGMMYSGTERTRSLFSKSRFQEILSCYEKFKHDDYYQVTIELIYGHGWKVEIEPPSDEFYISVDAIQRR